MVERSAKEVGQDKNMAPGVLHHHQNCILVVIAKRRYEVGVAVITIATTKKADKHFMKPKPGYILWYILRCNMYQIEDPVIHINIMKLHPR